MYGCWKIAELAWMILGDGPSCSFDQALARKRHCGRLTEASFLASDNDAEGIPDVLCTIVLHGSFITSMNSSCAPLFWGFFELKVVSCKINDDLWKEYVRNRQANAFRTNEVLLSWTCTGERWYGLVRFLVCVVTWDLSLSSGAQSMTSDSYSQQLDLWSMEKFWRN